MSHRKLYYDTLFEGYDVEVFQYTRQQRTFITLKRILEMMQRYASFLKEIQEKSLYKTDTELTANDEIVTLSTCDYALDPEAGRLVVHAKLVKEIKEKV